jgi:hypothetical protein
MHPPAGLHSTRTVLQPKLSAPTESPHDKSLSRERSAAAGALEIHYQVKGHAWRPPEVLLIELPPDVSRHLYPSRSCKSDKLVRLAAKEFGNLGPNKKVVGICNWIHNHLDHLPGATDEHTSAVDCLILRARVCRDFAISRSPSAERSESPPAMEAPMPTPSPVTTFTLSSKSGWAVNGGATTPPDSHRNPDLS